MNKDLLVGLAISILVHFFVLNPFHGKNTAPKYVPPPKDDVVALVMPPLDEDKPEDVKELEDEPVENQLAPPSLQDLPSVSVTTFSEPLEPPPPPGLTVSKNAITIPITKPGSGFGKGLKDLFDINNLDQKPIGRVQPPPQYPYEMSRAGISGTVVVEFIISANGDVIDTQVKSSTHREFEVPAMQAVQKWKFKPGRKGGRAVATRISQAIEFNLEDTK